MPLSRCPAPVRFKVCIKHDSCSVPVQITIVVQIHPTLRYDEFPSSKSSCSHQSLPSCFPQSSHLALWQHSWSKPKPSLARTIVSPGRVPEGRPSTLLTMTTVSLATGAALRQPRLYLRMAGPPTSNSQSEPLLGVQISADYTNSPGNHATTRNSFALICRYRPEVSTPF